MNCPKCGVKISPFDLKPNCKNCGVNILIYSQEYLLERDAKRTELEFASGRIVLAKVKAAFIGGALPIARIIFTILCIAALVVPFADLSILTPAFSADISLGGIGIYKLVSERLLTAIPGLTESVLFGAIIKRFLVLTAILLAVALTDVVLAVVGILNFINIKKSAKAMSIISIIGMVFCIAFYIVSFAVGSVELPSFISFRLGFGALVASVMFLVNCLINAKISKTDVVLKVHEHDFERKETLKKIKNGEIDFDDLPLPVFETEEEKKQRIKELEEMLKSEEAE